MPGTEILDGTSRSSKAQRRGSSEEGEEEGGGGGRDRGTERAGMGGGGGRREGGREAAGTVAMGMAEDLRRRYEKPARVLRLPYAQSGTGYEHIGY